MKFSELQGLTAEELGTTLTDTEKHLFQLRFQSATDRLETPSEITKARKTIARVKTEQRRRELTAMAALPAEQIGKRLTELAQQTEGPGKRRVKRTMTRLQDIQIAQALKVAPAATSAKGK